MHSATTSFRAAHFISSQTAQTTLTGLWMVDLDLATTAGAGVVGAGVPASWVAAGRSW